MGGWRVREEGGKKRWALMGMPFTLGFPATPRRNITYKTSASSDLLR
jgi:hypothetical protein